MNEEMMKSLVALIDESLAEIEELKKSDRFAASEVSIGDSESGMEGRDKNGSIDKADEDKDDDEDEDKDDEDKDMDKAEGKNSEADPNAGSHEPAYKSVDEDSGFDEKLQKSKDEVETLMKSYIDEKVGGLETKLESLMTAVRELGDAPVPAKGADFKDVQPLHKSEPEQEPLSKSQVIDSLFDLKKSGEKVDTLDITSAELGSPADLARVAQKYNIK